MSKRRADRDITKDDPDSSTSTDDPGRGFQQADSSRIAAREIIRVRRKNPAELSSSSSSAFQPSKINLLSGVTNKRPAEEKSASQQDSPKRWKANDSNSWACACGTKNPTTLNSCRACEKTKPSTSTPTASGSSSSSSSSASASFSFSSSSSSSNGKSAVPTFSFSAASGPGSSLFSFSSSTAPSTASSSSLSSKPATFGSFSFTSAAGSSSTSGSLSFGSLASKEPAVDFGKSGTNTFSFSTTPLAPKKLEEEAKPKLREEFKDKKADPTGEEDDTVHFRTRAKIYTLRSAESEQSGDGKDDSGDTDESDQNASKWRESGVGELRVNSRNKDGKLLARLIVRIDKTHRLVLNAPVFKDMTFAVESEKYVKVTSQDLQGKPAVFLIRVKTATEAQQLHKQIADLVKQMN